MITQQNMVNSQLFDLEKDQVEAQRALLSLENFRISRTCNIFIFFNEYMCELVKDDP